jgi:hypothetical protein
MRERCSVIASEIVCDGCGLHGATQGDGVRYGRWRPHAARLALAEAGWRVGALGGRDFCPRCKEEREAPCLAVT